MKLNVFDLLKFGYLTLFFGCIVFDFSTCDDRVLTREQMDLWEII